MIHFTTHFNKISNSEYKQILLEKIQTVLIALSKGSQLTVKLIDLFFSSNLQDQPVAAKLIKNTI